MEEDVIFLSSDDSDVEFISSFSTKQEPPPPPLSSVRVDVGALGGSSFSPSSFDRTNSRRTSPELKIHKGQSSSAWAPVDFAECGVANGTAEERENLQAGDGQIKISLNENQTSDKKDFKLKDRSLRDSSGLSPQQDCGDRQPKLRCLMYHTPYVKLIQLPIVEAHVRELAALKCSVLLRKDHRHNSLSFNQLDIHSDAPGCLSNLSITAASNDACVKPSVDAPSIKVDESLLGQQHGNNSSGLCDLSDRLSSHSHATSLHLSELPGLDFPPHHRTVSPDRLCQVKPPPAPAEIASKDPTCEAEAERALRSPDVLDGRVPGAPSLSAYNSEDAYEGTVVESYKGDLGIDSPPSFLWREDSDEVNEESRFDLDFRAASEEDRRFVCPVALRKRMCGKYAVEKEGFGTPEVLCRQSLSLVYSTMEEDYTEGTLQLLSDLLQPGYCAPTDITAHLLRNVLLNQQCPRHLCVQAFSLLMRTQRHHMANKTTVPWDWELVTSVVAIQDCTKRCRCEVVRMLLEYVVQTLEDDFQAQRSVSSLHKSIAKDTLSCDKQFSRVRDVIKWLYSAIMKTAEFEERSETAKERDEQIRMVSLFQRMLSLALEVDCSPALNSVKLSQELFHMLISQLPLRVHRRMLLESLQGNLLRCKLLEHVLDYACPLKVPLPMSLGLLLHFLKHCTLAPDPTGGTEKWQKWEELIQLLWMLLLSYNKTMKGNFPIFLSKADVSLQNLTMQNLSEVDVGISKLGYLCSSTREQRSRGMVFKADDKVSRSAICEAVDAFLSRSQADLGQALPLHVEESLTYLQDHLLDVCQC